MERLWRQLRRYLLTGGLAATVDLGAFVLLHAAGLGIVAAAASSFALGAVVNFTLTARYVFGAQATAARFAAFLGFALAGLAINTAVTAWTAAALPIPPWTPKVCGIGVAFGFNFLANALIVFRAPPAGR